MNIGIVEKDGQLQTRIMHLLYQRARTRRAARMQQHFLFTVRHIKCLLLFMFSTHPQHLLYIYSFRRRLHRMHTIAKPYNASYKIRPALTKKNQKMLASYYSWI
jgi:hypothetical protein